MTASKIGKPRREDTVKRRIDRSPGRVALAALIVALALAVAGCGGGGEEEEAPPATETSAAAGDATAPAETTAEGEAAVVRMGIEPWIGYGPWWVADANGYDTANGCDIQITNFTTDADINSAFAAGQLDVSNIATHTGLRFIGAGLPVKIVLFEDVSRTADAMLAGPGVESIADIEGKTVAFEEGTTSDLLLQYALAQNGLSIDDVEVVPISAADAGAAAIAGRVDVAVTYEPYLTAALNQDPDFNLIYTAGERPGLISDILVANSDFAAENPDAITCALKAWGQAVDFYNSNTEEAQQIIAESVGAKPEELKESFAGVDLYDLAQSLDFLDTQFVDLAGQIKETLQAQGTLEGDPDPASVLDTSFLQQAVAGS